jgi:hypothetical protein
MRIGIDISQIVYEGTGVARYVRNLTVSLIENYPENDYVIFGSSLRKRKQLKCFVKSISNNKSHIKAKIYPFPPFLLDILWNKLHIIPIEFFTGKLDIFWSSDWIQPPLMQAKGVTTVHDLVYLRFPKETNPTWGFLLSKFQFLPNILATQSRRMYWVARECRMIFCDSKSTQSDLLKFFKITADRTTIIYPGYKYL